MSIAVWVVAGLLAVVFAASGRRREARGIVVTLILLTLSAFVAWGG